LDCDIAVEMSRAVSEVAMNANHTVTYSSEKSKIDEKKVGEI